MDLIKNIRISIIIILILNTSNLFSQTQCQETFVCPGQPSSCTYTYNGSWFPSAPTSLTSTQSICILSDYSGNLNFQAEGTIYVAPNVTFSGTIQNYNNTKLIIEGTMNLNQSPNFNGAVQVNVCESGNLNIGGTTNLSPNTIFYNAGTIVANGDFNFNSTTTFINYSTGTFTINGGSASIEFDGLISNCGLLESITTGMTQFNGSSNIYNYCSFYVKNDFRVDNSYTNTGLIVVDGTAWLNSGNLINNGVFDANNIFVDNKALSGNNTTSLLIVRGSAKVQNGGSIIDNYYYGPTINCLNTCTINVTEVDQVYRNYVTMEEYFASCGGLVCSAPTDNIPPEITCPSDITQEITSGTNCSATISVPNPTYYDNCHVDSVTWEMSGATSGSSATAGINVLGTQTFNIGTTTVTYTVTDVHGTSVSCSFTVTVNDKVPPQITCPSDITLNNEPGICGVNASNVTLGDPIISDNCALSSTPLSNNAPSVFSEGTTEVIWTVTDEAGNTSTCIQKVTVIGEADLSLVKTVNNSTPNYGDEIIFTIEIVNNGPCPVDGVQVKDVLQDGLTYVSSTATTGSFDNVTGVWDLSSEVLNVNDIEILKINVKVGDCGTIVNFAEIISSAKRDPDSTPNNGQ